MGELIRFPLERTAPKTTRRSLMDRISRYALKRESIQTRAGVSIPVFHLPEAVFASVACGTDEQPWIEANAAGTGLPTL